ncbi:chromate transporter [Mycoplasmatota bacterium zrk1]
MIWRLVLEILMIVFFTFGGGAVFIPMFEKTLVESLGIFTPVTYTSIIAVVNSLPGVTGGKIASYAGFFSYGWIGFILASLAFIVPGIIMMVVAYKFVNRMKQSRIMKDISLYIKPIVVGIFLSIIVKFLDLSIKGLGWIEGIVIFGVAFYLLDQKKIQPILVIIMAIIYGIIKINI